MKKNILNLSDEVIGRIFRELYSKHELFVRNVFEQTEDMPLTPKFVVGKMRELGLDECTSQLYLFATGLYLPIKERSNPFKEIQEWQAAYSVAEDFGISVDEVNPKEALEYISKKQNMQ